MFAVAVDRRDDVMAVAGSNPPSRDTFPLSTPRTVL